MYTHFFRLTRDPFSISPDPRYLFMSHSHHEALAHLMYGTGGGGGVVVLTGEIGAGKTTVCRCFLDRVPDNCNVGYIFNPKLTVNELLQAICEEFHVVVPRHGGNAIGAKDYIDALNRHLLEAHAQGRNNVLVIDEAQNLAVDVLEQLRLLTNLETNERKLLQIILIGQPELRDILARPELEQLAQRIIARFHLGALTEQETASYIQHRLSTAGLTSASPFQQPHMQLIHQLTRGIPRRINLLCDRALLGAYSRDRHEVDRELIQRAAHELFATEATPRLRRRYAALAAALAVLAAGTATWTMGDRKWEQTLGPHLPVASASALHNEKVQIAPVTVREQANAAPILSMQSSPADAALQSEEDGLRQLARLWNVTLPETGDPCETGKKNGLRCYRSESGFTELRQLDRPAVLKLRDGANRYYYVLLTSLAEAVAMLRVGETVQAVPLAALTRYFRGDFITLWRAPERFGETVSMTNQGPQVDWVAKQLAKVYGTRMQSPGQPFNAKMFKQVREFQLSQGLFIDGIVGPTTLMHLNRVAGLNEPSLHSAMTMNAAQSGK